MGPSQVHQWWLVYRYREQARSHSFFQCRVHWCWGMQLLGRRTAGRSCGEGACSRWAAQRPPGIGLRGGPGGLWPTGLGLLRSPAGASSLATCFVVAEHIPLWERACSRWGQVRYISGGWCTAIASKLAPTGFFSVWSIGVGACNCLADAPPAALVARELAPVGLRSGPLELACAVGLVDCAQPGWGCFAAQREQAPSPHVLWWPSTFPCGSELARDGARSGTSVVAGVPLSRASSLPQFFSVLGPLVLGHATAWPTHRRPLLWRGSLLPLGCAAAPGIGLCGGPGGLWPTWLGLLRSPAGASSLATGGVVAGRLRH